MRDVTGDAIGLEALRVIAAVNVVVKGVCHRLHRMTGYAEFIGARKVNHLRNPKRKYHSYKHTSAHEQHKSFLFHRFP